MRRGCSLAASIMAIVLFCGASPIEFPDEVVAHIRDMADVCKQIKGKPQSDPTVRHGDLAAGVEFWAIDEGTFPCEGASLFSGSGGSQVSVYLSTTNGHAKQAFVSGTYGLTIEHVQGFSRIWIGVGGRLCGQKGDPTHAEAMSCERPLTWDAHSRKLDFAPLSEARFPGGSAPFAGRGVEPSFEKIPYDAGAELDGPKNSVFREYWGDLAARVNWTDPVVKRGTIYNWPITSADKRELFLTTLQSPSVCDPLCPVRVFTAQHRKIMDILACKDRTQHGLSPDRKSFVACSKTFPIPQVDERTALLENAPLGSDPEAYLDVVSREQSKPANAPKPIRVDSALHNNSQVLISEWKDGTVEISYDVPRPGLPVARGTLLFRGVRDGSRYSGTVFTFKAGCTPAPYMVTGVKDYKRDQIVLAGAVPRRDPYSCSVIGESTQSRQAKLVFDTKFYGDE